MVKYKNLNSKQTDKVLLGPHTQFKSIVFGKEATNQYFLSINDEVKKKCETQSINFFNDNKKENFKTQEKRKLRDYIVSYCIEKKCDHSLFLTHNNV